MDTLDMFSTKTHILKDGIKVLKKDAAILIDCYFDDDLFDVGIVYKSTKEDIGESALCGRETFEEAMDEALCINKLHGLDILLNDF